MTSFTELSGPLGKADIAERGWLHETHPDMGYSRWVFPYRLLRDDEYGIEITFRPRRLGDVTCGARTIEPGVPGCDNYEGVDASVPHEVVCTFAGDHGEAPHIGVIPCRDMENSGRCSELGGYHLVIVGFAIRPGERATEQERTTS